MKYLKTWMGVVSGSLGGRDDGYPERKLMIVDNVGNLVDTYDPEAEYYKLEKVDVSEVVRAIKYLEGDEQP